MTAKDVTLLVCHADGDPSWSKAEVVKLARKLTDAGAQVLLDVWEEERNDGQLSDHEWQDWMRRAFKAADRIVCLGSAYFNGRYEPGSTAPGGGRGVAFEAALLDQWLYDARQENRGRILLYLPQGVLAPERLRGRCTQYECSREEADLIRKACSTTGIVELKRWRAGQLNMLANARAHLYVAVTASPQKQIPMAALQDLEEQLARLEVAPILEQVPGYTDVLDAVVPSTRAFVLGDAGAGKTFVLLKVLERDLGEGRPAALIDLAPWRHTEADFETFVLQQVSEGGATASAAIRDGRCRLLLDGLDALPAEVVQRRSAQISAWLQQHRECPVLLSCRLDDPPVAAFDFIADRFVLRPLRAQQIRAVLRKYIPVPAAADALFWRIAGGEAIRLGWVAQGAETDDSQLDDYIEGKAARWLAGSQLDAWQAACRDVEREYELATNPRTLGLLVQMHEYKFRERDDWIRVLTGMCLRQEARKRGDPTEVGRIEGQLAELAEQLQRAGDEPDMGRGAPPAAARWSEAGDLEPNVAAIALGARLLRIDRAELRFRHRWLQDFYLRLGRRLRRQNEHARRLQAAAAHGPDAVSSRGQGGTGGAQDSPVAPERWMQWPHPDAGGATEEHPGSAWTGSIAAQDDRASRHDSEAGEGCLTANSP